MQDIQLSPHFKLSEFTKSATAKALHIPNIPNSQNIQNLKALCVNVLEPLRAIINRPIVIGSGFRCPKLNAAVGGVSGSQHLLGEACDIHIPDEKTGREWFLELMDGRFDQLIWEKATPTSTHHWIHVSYREGRCRQQVIRNLTKYKK